MKLVYTIHFQYQVVRISYNKFGVGDEEIKKRIGCTSGRFAQQRQLLQD